MNQVDLAPHAPMPAHGDGRPAAYLNITDRGFKDWRDLHCFDVCPFMSGRRKCDAWASYRTAEPQQAQWHHLPDRPILIGAVMKVLSDTGCGFRFLKGLRTSACSSSAWC